VSASSVNGLCTHAASSPSGGARRSTGSS
jgi:hypothetical protein